MLNNFTPDAQQVLALARSEAERLNNNYAGTEHLLLGLIKLGQGIAANVLTKMGLNLEIVRTEVEKLFGVGPETKLVGNIPYTPRVTKVLARAAKEAKSLNHTYVGTEHILLGLLRETEGAGPRVIKDLKVDIERTRNEILKELDPNFTPPEADPEFGLERFKPSVARPAVGSGLGKDPQPNFTPHAQQTLALARKEADRLSYNYVGSEHLLFGLTRTQGSGALRLFETLGVRVENVRAGVEKWMGKGTEPKMAGKIPYTPRLKRILAQAAREAEGMGHSEVGTEHMVLGCVIEGEGDAWRVLRSVGITEDSTREAVRKMRPRETAPKDDAPALGYWEERLSGALAGNVSLLRTHPVLRRMILLVESTRGEKETAIKAQDFERAAELRFSEKSLIERLESTCQKVASDPTFGLRSSDVKAKYCEATYVPEGECFRVTVRDEVVQKLLEGRVVVLVGEAGSGRRTMAGFIAKQLAESTSEYGCALLRAFAPIHEKLAGASTDYEGALADLLGGCAESRDVVLFVADIHLCACAESSSEQMARAWACALAECLDDGLPLLGWTTPTHLEKLKSTWPRLSAEAEFIILPPLDQSVLDPLLGAEVTRLSAKHGIAFDDRFLPELHRYAPAWAVRCGLAEPGCSLTFIGEVIDGWLASLDTSAWPIAGTSARLIPAGAVEEFFKHL